MFALSFNGLQAASVWTLGERFLRTRELRRYRYRVACVAAAEKAEL
jgi:hypothetical protein